MERVERFAQGRGLFEPGTAVVAVSGGQDSLCLLDTLYRLRSTLGIEIHVAHLNHMLRGAQAEAEAEFVRHLAAELDLPATVGSINVPAFRARHRLTKQVAARYARLRFLAGVAAVVGALRVATGHTADDGVETLLLNLLRGSGLSGMAAMAPARTLLPGQLGPALEEGDWRSERLPAPPDDALPVMVRPVLALFREETEAYCRARGLEFRTDPSNLDPAYRRNWVRQRLIPLLESEVSDARRRLWSAADLLADDHAIVAKVVGRAWEEVATVDEDRVEVSLAGWAGFDPPLRRHLLRRAVEALAGTTENLARVHVDALEQLIREGPAGSRMDLPLGLRFEKGYRSFSLALAGWGSRPAVALSSEPVELPVPGRVRLPSGTLEVELEELSGAGGGLPSGLAARDRWSATADADEVGPALLVRRRRPGDRFIPLGMSEPKKLQDYLVDEKVPRSERDRIPIVATPNAVVWVAGYRLDDRFKVTPATRRALRLRYVSDVGGAHGETG